MGAEKLKARKMLEYAAESPASSARFVSLRFAPCINCLGVDVRNWDASKQVRILCEACCDMKDWGLRVYLRQFQ
jgi:hypothetical protein